jgi:tRNA-2-methylthio-N6-dimethylallyladenosine synthase
MTKAFIQTFGCQMNEHDSQRMARVLADEGYTLTSSPDDASLILLNTCSVRENPENKVYSHLGRLRKLKAARPDLIVAVGGCVAQQEGETILRREKLVDIVFGPDNMFRLPEMLARVRAGERVLMTKWQKRPGDRVVNFVPEEYVERGHVEGIKAYIAITKGCDNFCTFCIVPYTRGREVSRDAANVVAEARTLVERGAREIWLLGQNVNSYRAGDWGFHELLDAVSLVEGIVRVRFTSPHPNDWDNRLSDLMAERATICNHLHLPFQAGANGILERMNRQHTIEHYLDKVAYMQRVNPGIALTTDLIVGFPGETDADFEETLRVLETVRFSQIFPFKYSTRPGTRAAKYDDDVPRAVKDERLARVIALQDRINDELMAAHVGRVEHVLIDSANTRVRGAMNGRTDGYRPVTVRDARLDIGQLVPVRVTGYRGHWLEGEPAATPATAAAG